MIKVMKIELSKGWGQSDKIIYLKSGDNETWNTLPKAAQQAVRELLKNPSPTAGYLNFYYEDRICEISWVDSSGGRYRN